MSNRQFSLGGSTSVLYDPSSPGDSVFTKESNTFPLTNEGGGHVIDGTSRDNMVVSESSEEGAPRWVVAPRFRREGVCGRQIKWQDCLHVYRNPRRSQTLPGQENCDLMIGRPQRGVKARTRLSEMTHLCADMLAILCRTARQRDMLSHHVYGNFFWQSRQ